MTSTSGSGNNQDAHNIMKLSESMDESKTLAVQDFSISWHNLTVRGYQNDFKPPATLAGALWSLCNLPFSLIKSIRSRCFALQTSELKVLSDLNGFARPGDMILVLGKPGAGCSSFLKVITGHNSGFSSIAGDVRYGRQNAKEFLRNYSGELLYNHEIDTHHPSLTVQQTLEFAASTRRVAEGNEANSTKLATGSAVDAVLRTFNLEHVRHTLIGNAHIRGLSGGERKRVSIAEMMLARAAVNAWDSSTRGLDAASALDFVVSLRCATKLQRSVTFATMYQASENIFALFDKVLVFEQGRQVYFGPIDTATDYFENLGFVKHPRQTSPDFLTGCTDSILRAESQNPEIRLLDADKLAASYNASQCGISVLQELICCLEDSMCNSLSPSELEASRSDLKDRTAFQKSTVTVPYHAQVGLLVKRQFLLRAQDRLLLLVSLFTTIAFGIILGTLWLQQPLNATGAFTRGGVLYISLMVNTGQAFGELAGAMLGRPLMNKHKDYSFHRPSALWLGQVVVDTVFASIQIFLFTIVVYFLCGLALDAGAFFIFYLAILTTYITLTALFRAIGCMSSDYDWALKLSATLLTLFVLAGGYFIQYQSEPVWLRWIYWINPFALGFSVLMINEFRRIMLHCAEANFVPAGQPQYLNHSYQTCLIQGAQPGSKTVTGMDYIKSAFIFDASDQWRNFGILLVLILIFLIIQTVCAEYLQYGDNFQHRHLAFVKAKDSQTTERVREKKACKPKHQTSSILTFKNLSYDIKTKTGGKRLLNEINGYVQPGELTALMGASGAGKTTLLDVLSLRKTLGIITGDIHLDGSPLGAEFRRRTAYAEQNDIHDSTQTVREAIRFAATLRQDFDVPLGEKYQYVEEIIALLELEPIANAVIGSSGGGSLSAEQMKRLTIAVELAAKPDLLLFLDEPTTGLDSQSAFNIVRLLKKIASRGQAVLCTIHQPNPLVFASFDKLFLLQQTGECVYFGDIGQDAVVLRGYFASHKVPCPTESNVAEWMLDIIRPGRTQVDWVAAWRASDHYDRVLQIIDSVQKRQSHKIGEPRNINLEYATPIWYQIEVCCRRALRAFCRSPKYASTQLFNHTMIGLLTGLTFVNINHSPISLQYRMFIIFRVTMLPTLIVAQIVPKFHAARAIFHRESAARTYRSIAHATSQLVSDLIFSILCATTFFLPLYLLPSFSALGVGYQFGMVLLTELFSVTLGQLLAAITPTTLVALFINPFLTVAMTLFCGIAVPKDQMPAFWRDWLYPLNPFTYLSNGMAAMGLLHLKVECSPSDLYTVPIPPDETCGKYMTRFFEHGGLGYVIDPASTESCLYCQFSNGGQFLTSLGLSYSSPYRQLGIYAAFLASNILLFLLACRFLSFNRR